MQVTPKQFIFSIGILWIAVALCAVLDWNSLLITWVCGVPLLLFVPGYFLYETMSLSVSHHGVRVVLMVALSILLFMGLFLLGNTVLFRFGVARPLDPVPAVFQITVLLCILSALAYPTLKPFTVQIPRYLLAHTMHETVFLILPLLLILLAGVGAITLNRGGDATVTMAMLGCSAFFMVALVVYAPMLRAWVVSSALSLFALAMLFMTSLRGWFISGHDIQREFFVFQLAKDAGRWSMEAYVDAYNACLSITILPTVFANILQVPDVYVYKILMQALFALTVIVVYAIATHILNVRYAIVASMLFISFPTFFQDMPSLIRQEIAFVFFSLMLYVLYFESMERWKRIVLTSLLGVGVVISHYSTTYVVIAVLGITYTVFPFATILFKQFFTKRVQGAVCSCGTVWKKIATPLLCVLLITTFVWVTRITGSDAYMRTVISSVWSSVRGERDSVRSLDIALIFGFGRVQSEQTMDAYIRDVVNPRRNGSPDEFYATSTYSQYPVMTLQKTELPITQNGVAVHVGGYDFVEVALWFGQVLAKIVQASVVVGMLYVLWWRRFVRFAIPLEYYLFATASLFFVALCVVLPILSLEYGVLRAFLQSMVIIAPFMVLGLCAVAGAGVWFVVHGIQYVTNRCVSIHTQMHAREWLVYTFSILFFLYATGFVTQLTGGNVPPVHLNNVGDDYKQYVTEPSEYVAIAWLEDELAREYDETGKYPLVQSDRFGEMKLQAYLHSRIGGDMFPGSIHKDAYVFLTPAIRYGGTAVVRHEGSAIKYAYMPEFLEQHKSLVYSNGDVHIYR